MCHLDINNALLINVLKLSNPSRPNLVLHIRRDAILHIVDR